MRRQDVEKALRYAAGEIFPVERLERNERAIEERLRELTIQDSALTSRPRVLRAAFMTAMMFLLFSAGSSALYIVYENFFAADEKQNSSEKNTVDGQAAPLAFKTFVREGQPVVAESQVPVPVNIPYFEKGKNESRTNLLRRGERKSMLDKQLALFKAAKGFARDKKYQQSISKLDVLDMNYPDGPLGFESKELRATCLVQLRRFAPAETLVNKLIRNSRSNRKKAALMRFLGDIQLRQGRCDKAVKSYRLGLGLGLRPADSQAAKNGIAKCTQ